MGAVNTVVLRHGRLIGHNTDGSGWRWGFTRALLPGATCARGAAGCRRRRLGHRPCRAAPGSAQLVLVDTDGARARALAEPPERAATAGRRATAHRPRGRPCRAPPA
jgi:shikimate dehydrogenase